MSERIATVRPDQIKSFYDSRKSSKVYQHTNYDYYQPEDFEEELNEFISYSEIKWEFKQYEAEYNDIYSLWKQCSLKEKKEIIQSCGDQLEYKQEEERSRSVKHLVYISLGNYGEYRGMEQKEQHMKIMKENNQLLYDHNIIPALKQSLSNTCQQLEAPSSSLQSETVMFYCQEIDMHLTILYLVVHFNKDKEQLKLEDLTEFLFDLVVRLKEHFTRTFPLKKLMLTLYKLLVITLGPLDQTYQDLKAKVRTACELPLIDNKSQMVKCTPEELHAFYQQSQEKYPTFIPSRLPEKIMSPLTATATNQLAISMGLSKASKNVDLPYQTLFPSKNNVQQQQPTNKKATVVTEITETNLLPFAEKGAKEPYYLTEANSAWLKHLYISVADYQVIHEREKAVHRWEHWNKNRTSQADSDEWDEMIYHRLNEKDSDKMHCIDQLYSSIMPNFQSIVVVILKLLLSTVSIGKDKEAEILEDINITRNRETISKAVSGILLLLLKWFKVSHVLKFEYLSQVLVDSGCMLLILKLLGLQEVALLASKKTDDQTQCFFEYMLEKEGSFEEESTKEEFYTNKRNLFWSINLLRVLQMLTKRKTHRISLLVQYKSSAILKRLLKVGHPVMDLYVLKNLKNQIPLMGRKWRSTNMKTISSIYAHCLTCLSDDWLSSPEGSMDSEEGATKEINLRMLTRLYNGHRYMPSILPSMDDMVGPESTLFYITENDHSENSSGKLPDYGLNSTLLLDGIELDVDFKRNYREWLEKDVYSTEEEDEEDDEEELCTDTTQNWTIGTPIPDTMPIPLSADDLTKEINKLYLEELQHEFEEKAKRQKETEMVQEVEDGWDKPIDFNHNAWGNAAVNPNENDEEADEVEPEVDPLGNIHWDSLTEEDLKRRLTLVEEKTVQRWLNVDMNDPRYLKVLNTFEGEGDLIPVDDEGWPI